MTEHLRIHIVPVGYDSTRITEPIISQKADRVYFVRHEGDKEHSQYFQFIKKELAKKKDLEIHEEFVNIWDLFQCIKKFKEIVNLEQKNHIYINVSTGSKITAIAGMITAMLTENVEPYYVHKEYSSQNTKRDIKKEVINETVKLPVFEINQPPKDYLTTLQLLSEKEKMKKSELIKRLEDKKIIQQKDKEKSFFSEHAKHSQLRSILDPMERNWEFIEIEGKGKKSRIKITRQGDYALKIFDNKKVD